MRTMKHFAGALLALGLISGAAWADSPRQVAQQSDVVFSMVGFPADVRAILGVPCTLDNDVRAAAEGLRAQRILGDAPDFLYLSVGTGIAAGVVVGDEVLHGAHRFAGEAGHMVVEPGGPVCACGQHGCLESTVFGHPGALKEGPKSHPWLDAFRSVDLGLTFENDGLRGRVELDYGRR